ncbi:putative methyltransferase C20orf7 family protein [Roseibium sp. TrichSKD4]|uniref:class I SAM-dependent methyltransferase n=1 Tax=Roseibium sp. TrichSKD4 TaxID=744980 RepID=UPI0001E56574|nr:methyltransferase domain-containing protein [Roseibium sp. TrichSKD4]EFO33508.1 putative methyltransferase C20orf7 family protein [Roseibium sp. TrichSKD4]
MAQPEIFDRQLLKTRWKRALNSAPDGADFLLKNVAEDLGDRLVSIKREFTTAIELGGHSTHLEDALEQTPNVGDVFRFDVLCTDKRFPAPACVVDDACPPLAEESVDLIVSALHLHLINDLPGTLIQLNRALRPDGLFLATLPGMDTLWELRDVMMQAEIEVTGGVSPRISPFGDTRDLGSLLQRAGFALPVTDVDRLIVRYDTMFDLLRDLRAMGATSVLTERSKKPLRKDVLMKAAALYAEKYADPDGRIRATFSMVTMSGWRPHESQQQPLKPGSAKVRLADALGTVETPTE